MGALGQLVSRFAGGGGRGRRPAGGTPGSAGVGGSGGGRTQDEAIGRGVRGLLSKLRR